ncbi:MAG: YqgE/AlgH family protein [Flavobacteriaceae bacterium]|nr:YqgE/AlgH family protein [Flavobacteriaceae bacterium]
MSENIGKGQLLVSTPLVFGDGSFSQSVIILVESSGNGLVGLVLNHKLNKTLDDFADKYSFKQDLYRGGPVEMENLYFIHRLGGMVPNSIHISNGLYWSGDFKIVMELIENKRIQSNDVRFFLGYAGWSFHQLKQEIHHESWELVTNSYGRDLLSVPPQTLWKNEMSKLGGRYALWANAPIDPQLN